MPVSTILRPLCAAATLFIVTAASAQTTDPRAGLKAGYMDAGTAIRHMELLSSRPRPEGFFNPADRGDIYTANTDFAFRGTTVFLGNFSGFQIYDVSNPSAPVLKKAWLCPGGQGDVSVHGNLLFMSVEMPNGRVDCGAQGVQSPVSSERFRGVRIFDITNVDAPRQVAAVQTCRGSHTHTLVPHPTDKGKLYVYVQGTSGVRPAAELDGCSGGAPEQDPNTALFRIEIIEVSLAAPQDARIVNRPRIFADRASGNIAGLWAGGSHGEGLQNSAQTNQCHDITVYPEIGLAAGACSGNGILLDIKDPANPVRIDEVLDKNFAYWHSATFNNAGTKVLFTDEWGGGTAPRCRATDKPEWGANAIFELGADRKLTFQNYWKIPVAQTPQENCVAHNGSLVPVPGRDIFVQAWYQGGIAVTDFTDPANIKEIAYFDRGPMSDTTLYLGGYWSAYWYNGLIYGSEIGRGLDIFKLVPSEHLTANELEAASLVRWETFNPQLQTKITWPAHPAVARAYLDQLARGTAVPAAQIAEARRSLEGAERMTGANRRSAFNQLAAQATTWAGRASGTDAERARSLAETLRGLAAR
jgi:hypothetical protein